MGFLTWSHRYETRRQPYKLGVEKTVWGGL